MSDLKAMLEGCEHKVRLARVVERHVPIPNAAGDEVCKVCGVYWPCGERRHYDSLGIPVAQPEEGAMADNDVLMGVIADKDREIERLRAENERLRSIYGCKCEEVVRRAEQTEARLAQMVGALMEAGHGTQRGGHSRGVTGDCGLCDALAAARPGGGCECEYDFKRVVRSPTCPIHGGPLAAAQPEEYAMSQCQSCLRFVAVEDQMVRYVEVGRCAARVMVCRQCLNGVEHAPLPARPEKKL